MPSATGDRPDVAANNTSLAALAGKAFRFPTRSPSGAETIHRAAATGRIVRPIQSEPSPSGVREVKAPWGCVTVARTLRRRSVGRDGARRRARAPTQSFQREERSHIFGLGVPELLLIAALVVLLFGASKIPQLGRGIGEGIANFKRGLKEGGALKT